MIKDLTGKKFGRLSVVSEKGRNDAGSVLWECKCDCGNTCITSSRCLVRGSTKSCGCLNTESRQSIGRNNKNDLTGLIFGQLTVISDSGSDKYGQAKWLCRCSCGVDRVILGGSLTRGLSISCGCMKPVLISEKITKHGGCKDNASTSEYTSWIQMRDRCYNPKNNAYKNYGGRGIKVCSRWKNSFANFLADMGKKPSPDHSLDRFPNKNGHYELKNCRWADYFQQNGNRRDNVWLEYKGQKMILQDWARKLNVTGGGITYHIKNGKTFSETVEHFILR